MAIKEGNPKTFKCVRCGIQEEALPTGMTDLNGTDLNGGTHFVYTTPKGWWSITTPYEGRRPLMKLFCPDEAVTIVAGEVLERGRGG